MGGRNQNQNNHPRFPEISAGQGAQRGGEKGDPKRGGRSQPRKVPTSVPRKHLAQRGNPKHPFILGRRNVGRISSRKEGNHKKLNGRAPLTALGEKGPPLFRHYSCPIREEAQAHTFKKELLKKKVKSKNRGGKTFRPLSGDGYPVSVAKDLKH